MMIDTIKPRAAIEIPVAAKRFTFPILSAAGTSRTTGIGTGRNTGIMGFAVARGLDPGASLVHRAGRISLTFVRSTATDATDGRFRVETSFPRSTVKVRTTART